MEKTQEFFAEHSCKLRDLLEEIVNTDKRIEYGRSDEQPGGFYSHIRIRHMHTAGGRQFCVKQISHGTEGGGFYTTDVDSLLSYADKLVRYVERPLNNAVAESLMKQMRAKGSVKPLEWWCYDPNEIEEAFPMAGALNSRHAGSWEENATVIDFNIRHAGENSVDRKCGQEPFRKKHPHIIALFKDWAAPSADKIQNTIDRYKQHKASGNADWEGELGYFARCVSVAFKHRHH